MHWLLVDPKPRNWMLVAGVELVLSHTARLSRPERDDRLEAHRAKNRFFTYSAENPPCASVSEHRREEGTGGKDLAANANGDGDVLGCNHLEGCRDIHRWRTRRPGREVNALSDPVEPGPEFNGLWVVEIDG
jgi:hypothetical protein